MTFEHSLNSRVDHTKFLDSERKRIDLNAKDRAARGVNVEKMFLAREHAALLSD